MNTRRQKRSSGRMGVRAFARHRGCAPSAVVKALASGRITRNADGIDPAIADAQWAENTRERPPNGHASASTGNYMRERTRRESALASIAEMEVAARSGAMIPVDVAAEMWEGAVLRMKSAMMTSISKSAPRMVNLRTVAAAHAALEEVIYAALSACAAVGDEIERREDDPIQK